MTTDVPTTPRERLTPRQLLKLFEARGGRCCICGLPIEAGKKWLDTLTGAKGFIDEHARALGLGGSNKLANRGVAHIACAEIKTREQDMPAITKAKAAKRYHLGIAKDGPKIRGPSFTRSSKTIRRQSRDVLELPPRRSIYQETT